MQQYFGVFQFVYSTTYGKRNINLLSYSFYQLDGRLTFFVRSRDVEKHQFVCSLLRILPSELNWIASIPQIHEVNAFYSTAIFDIQTGDNTFRQHTYILISAFRFQSLISSILILFS